MGLGADVPHKRRGKALVGGCVCSFPPIQCDVLFKLKDGGGASQDRGSSVVS